MPKPLKVMTIVGTRPEIIRLSRVINQLDIYCHHLLVHTGQNFDYELNDVFFSELEIRKPDIFMGAAGATAAETIGKVIIATDAVLAEHQPDAILLLGDTNSSLASIAAKRRKIPIFHMEAGNRCFDFRVPEEINRRIVDHISDINLTYSQIAREYLLREGFPPEQVICIGSPMREVLEYYRKGIEASDVLNRMNLASGEFFLVSTHREENVDSLDRLKKLLSILETVGATYGLPIIVSTHPRTRKQLDKIDLQQSNQVKFCKPFSFFDYVKLQCSARAVLSDSGTITEESSILNFPALNMRDMHERPEGFEEGSVMMVGLEVDRVMQGLSILADQPRNEQRLLRLVNDYAPTNVSDKVLRVIVSYTAYVNQRIWGKSI